MDFKEIFFAFFAMLGDFTFYYPVFMSLVWVVGGLFFFFTREMFKSKVAPKLATYPFVSVLIPARNEQEHIEETVQAVLCSNYPALEIILIDDASTDNTPEIVDELTKQYENVRVLHLEQNMGKASGLNHAFLISQGEIIICIDADCILDKDAIYWLVWHFENSHRVGAVTGSPQVRNRTTILAQLQTAEYTSVIGLIKRTQRILGKVLTISGVIGAFRRDALIDAGLWSFDMYTEDIDITWKLERHFWDVRYETAAIGWILVPETIKGLWKQRLRWAQGGVETVRRYKSVWTDWHQRRIWIVYIDYVLGIIWSYSFLLSIIYWLVCNAIGLQDNLTENWNGCIIAVVCLVQFFVSITINLRYDKTLLPTYFWVIWYPVIYWAFNAFATIVAFPRGMTKKFGTPSTWVSPDRGLKASKK